MRYQRILPYSGCLSAHRPIESAGEKLQIILNAGYAVIFFAAAIPAVLFGGLHGLAAAIFAVNIVRYLAVTLAGMFCRQQSQNNAEAQ